jgi:hypothetical protein
VSYTATALDNVDGSVPARCMPPSGSTFPVGATTVACTAVDAAGNTATGSFSVHVRAADEQLDALLAAVDGVGPGAALSNKVGRADALLAAGDVGGACTELDGVIALARGQRGKKLTVDQADALVAEIRELQAVIGC